MDRTALQPQPTGDITVDLELDRTGEGISVSPTSLTFTIDSWNMAQTVTVIAKKDDNAVNE